jgi:hypothetical protein
MRNALDKCCRENKKHAFYVQQSFSENRTVYEIMSKKVAETEGEVTSQHSAYALHAGLARLHARTRVYTPTRPGTHIRARTHTQTLSNNYCFSTPTMIPERPSMLRYTYTASRIPSTYKDYFIL